MRKLLLLPLLALISIVSYSQTKWDSSYEDENLKIEYYLANCNDAVNGFNFQYYLVKLQNKSSRSINVTYVLGTSNGSATEEELTTNLILAPGEIRTGNCNEASSDLKYFAKDMTANSIAQPFKISKIKVYEL